MRWPWASHVTFILVPDLPLGQLGPKAAMPPKGVLLALASPGCWLSLGEPLGCSLMWGGGEAHTSSEPARIGTSLGRPGVQKSPPQRETTFRQPRPGQPTSGSCPGDGAGVWG